MDMNVFQRKTACSLAALCDADAVELHYCDSGPENCCVPSPHAFMHLQTEVWEKIKRPNSERTNNKSKGANM